MARTTTMPAFHRPALSALLAPPLLALTLAATAGAAAFVPISDEQLADRAPVILEGRIVAAEPAPGDRPAIDYLVATERLIKGGLPSGWLMVRVPGGVRPDGVGLHVRGAPAFREGDEALLFLEPRSDGTFALHQLMLGAFRITTEGGLRVAKRELEGTVSVLPPGRPVPADGPRDALAFRRWLEQRTAGRTPPARYFLPPKTGAAAHGFRTVVSSTDPPPFGCGADGGHAVRWFDFAAPGAAGEVGWRTYFSGQPGVPGGGIDAFRDALAAWTDDPNTPIRYAYDGLTAATAGFSANDGINAVLFADPNDEIGGSFDGGGLLAIGGPWFDCQTTPYQGERFHPILAGDIITQDGLELFFAATPDPTAAAEQLFAHELGHTLGLAHSEDPEALMYAIFHPDRRGAALHVDDLAGVLYLYGPAGPGTPSPPSTPIPPAAPSGLTATEADGGKVVLEWSDNSANESVFRIDRRQGDDFALLTTAAADATSFVDDSTLPETLYGYRVRSQNGAGASAYTAVAEILTGEDRRPAAPTSLRAAPLSSTEIRLAWQDNSEDETAFRVEILLASQWLQIPVDLAPDTRRVIVEGLTPASTFSFRLRAVNEYGASAASNRATTATFADDEDCVVTGDELCLLGGRFKVAVDYRNQHDRGSEGTATVVPSTDETGMFWFFGPENVELIVKALDGRHINQNYWIFYGALTDLEYRITLTDTVTGEVEIYRNPPGEICGLADTAAFPGPSEEPAPSGLRLASRLLDVSALGLRPEIEAPAPLAVKSGSCQPGPETLCLLDRRLSVEVRWQNPHGGLADGPGRAVADSDSTGTFWFFNIENTELVVKALDGGALNDHLWIFYGALTDLEYWITVTDTATGDRRVYHNPPGEVCGRADTEAFDADPAP